MAGKRGQNKIMVDNDFDVSLINYAEIEKYDFTYTPEIARPEVLGGYLSYFYKVALDDHYKKTHQTLSQNSFARQIVRIPPMNFSIYKSGRRLPKEEMMDALAKVFGSIIYDICGVARRIPKNQDAYLIMDIFEKLSQNERRELLENAKNLLDRNEMPIYQTAHSSTDDFDNDLN